MIYILLALIAHFGNAVVFAIDKGLLESDGAISQPWRMAAYTGLLSIFTVVILPFSFALPTLFLIMWSFVSGLFFLLALWTFFIALKAGESSRVVPLVGSAVPIFTLLFAFLFLGELLETRQLLAVLVLITGGIFLSLSLRGVRGLSREAVLWSVVSGSLWAAHFSIMKFIYAGYEPFLAAFVYSRLAITVLSVVIFGWWLVKEYLTPSPSPSKGEGKTSEKRLIVVGAFLASKVLGSAMLILQNYAISLGSVTVVNALQGTQYLFLLILAAVISLWAPRLFREEVGRVALGQKVAGIVLIAVGLVFLV